MEQGFHRELGGRGVYHWRELLQALFLSRQTRVCRDKARLLSRQKYTYRDKTFVALNIFVTRIVPTKLTFVATNICLSLLKTRLLSGTRQT